MPTPAFWRQWHRWIGAPAALFLAFAAITGVLVAGTEFFGDGGLVVSMIWGLALFALTISGFLLYWRLYQIDRPERTGLRKIFF
jgi:uncharacterized iron-regulated membrane protein